jgi:phage tail sheath protein FI
MPEYLAPGVYVEEVSYRSKSIEGVSTTTTGFIGPARYGPIDLEPDIITSLGEFERVYGDRQKLQYGDASMHNYLWHAARAFFEEGGKRLYISRIFRPLTGTYPPADFEAAKNSDGLYPHGHASQSLTAAPSGGGEPEEGEPEGGGPPEGGGEPEGGNEPEEGGGGEAPEEPADNSLRVIARFPGSAGNMRVRFTLQMGQNILGVGSDSNSRTVAGLRSGDVVWIVDNTNPTNNPPGNGTLYVADQFFDSATSQRTWRFIDQTGNVANALKIGQLTPDADPTKSDHVRVVTVNVSVMQGDELPQVWSGLALDPAHEIDGAPDSLSAKFALKPSSLAQARTLPIIITLGDDADTGLDVLKALIGANSGLLGKLSDTTSSDAERSIDILLEGGNDGLRPGAAEYEGEADDTSSTKTGLKSFEDLEDISIVAAPGSTYGNEGSYRSEASQIMNLVISHASRMRYRIAVLDSGDGQSIADVRAMRARIDSTYAALYYPWVRVLDPVTRAEINLPPSGFVAGIYARNDVNRAVYKAPANEVVNLAIGFETLLNKSQQDVLNPEGINCFRFFEGRGYRLWGARTVSSDPEWKYVNLRRYFAYLERSLDKGTQWAVFEPNGSQLWANVRRTVEDFLFNEWQMGALLGDKPEKAYFVRCDRSTMTQNDLDNGRLVCLVGVAPLRPAEFVIFRIGQWTADRKQ